MSMIGAIALLFVCQLAGEAVHRLLGIPLPGAVIGMAFLLGWLALQRKERPTLDSVTKWLTAHLSIMFVPAAVGLVNEGEVLSRYGFALVASVVVSTVLTMVVTVLVFRWAALRSGRGREEGAA